MKKSLARIFIAALMQLLLIGAIYAQNADTGLVTQQLKYSRQFYTSQIGYQSRLLNGTKYLPYKTEDFVGNAYYNTTQLQNAYLRYDGTDFYDIPVLYDLNKGFIILKNQDSSGYMSLITAKLNEFIINNHTFIKITADSTEKAIKTGFYDVLYNGRTKLFARRRKVIEQEKSGITIRNLFIAYTDFYLYKENTYYDVSGKRDLLKVLKDKKQELEQYIKTNYLSFKKEDIEQSMVKSVSYYDQLTR